MTEPAGSLPDDAAIEDSAREQDHRSVNDYLSSDDWKQRLEAARAQREKALAARRAEGRKASALAGWASGWRGKRWIAGGAVPIGCAAVALGLVTLLSRGTGPAEIIVQASGPSEMPTPIAEFDPGPPRVALAPERPGTASRAAVPATEGLPLIDPVLLAADPAEAPALAAPAPEAATARVATLSPPVAARPGPALSTPSTEGLPALPRSSARSEPVVTAAVQPDPPEPDALGPLSGIEFTAASTPEAPALAPPQVADGAPSPDVAVADAGRFRLTLHTEPALATLVAIGKLGFRDPEVRPSRLGLAASFVAYYHPADGEAAARLAVALGTEAADMTGLHPSPPRGKLDVYLGR